VAKKKKGSKKVETPAWLATFADMMSLLLAFFVLLFSFSSIQESKFQAAMASMQGALGVLDTYPTVPIHDNFEHLPDMQRTLEGVKKKVEEIKENMEALKRSDEVKVSRNEEGLAIRLDSRFLFDLSSATLRSEAFEVLDGVMGSLKDLPNEVRVEGHTDNLPIKSSLFPSNWELSAARATAIIRYFESKGMDPRRMSAVGYGEWRPVVRNDSPENRQKNRRVEIFVDLLSPSENSPTQIGQSGG
jgi:chemotaxis protein MotB